jgi:adenylate cyclase
METLRQIAKKFAEWMGHLPARQIDLALAVVITGLALVVYSFVEIGGNTRTAGLSFLNNIELRSVDARFRMRGPRPVDPRIVIVDIDEKALQRVGAWPIPRSAYAILVDQLSSGGARVVAFDVAFPTPEKNSAVEALKRLEQELGPAAPKTVIDKIREIQGTSDNDVTLANSLRKANNVILGHLFLDKERAKSQDEAAASDYYYILSDKPFNQVLKAGSGDFDVARAWEGKRPGVPMEPEVESYNGRVMWGVESNIRLLAEAARNVGFFNNDADPDGTMRHALLLVRYQDKEFYASLPVQTLIVYEDIKPQSVKALMAENGLERMELGPYVIPTQLDGTGLINFAGPYASYPHYSMADVIDGIVPPSTFKDKIVFVGATALGIGDLRTTPFEGLTYMGVEIHANTLDNLLHADDAGRSFLHRGLNQEMIDIALILVMGLGLGYLFGRLKPIQSTAVAIAAIMVFSLINYFAFARLGMWLAFVIPVGMVIASYGAITSFRMVFEEREKRKIRKSFSSYLAPGVIALMEKDPKRYFRPGGEMKDLTVLFSDIRSFTTISEGMSPDELVQFLNEYLEEMTRILIKRWGTLDKYIGDAVMAFWGSPYPQDDHAVRGCAAALDMSARLDELNMKWEAQGRKTIQIGIGLNTAPVNVGNMGSNIRLQWTVMGDGVNLASRLEGQTKDYKCRIIVGEGTYAEAREHYVFRNLDKIQVKGKNRPVLIYELLAFAKDRASYDDLLQKWEAAIGLYFAGNWPGAIEAFETLLQRYPDDGPAHTLLKRCHEKLLEGAPIGPWSGVYVAKEK